MAKLTIGSLVHAYFADALVTMKGLRQSSIRSYRDAIRLFLLFASGDAKRPITRLAIADLTFDRVLRFLRYLEDERHNHARTRNHRLACLHGFFEYLAQRVPEALDEASKIAAIPMKRSPPVETQFLEREQIAALFDRMPRRGRHAQRDTSLLLFLYNTGARVQEVADLTVADLDFDGRRVRLHGKGDKWRTCPLWPQTIEQLRATLNGMPAAPSTPVFRSREGHALTRFGIYKIVRRRAKLLDATHARKFHVSPHVFRHTAAVHLLESGVDVNVIRGWLGHVSLDTTNRYAEITVRAKEEALRACEPFATSAAFPRKPVWQTDDSLLKWLTSL